jgi:hypothetical protein
MSGQLKPLVLSGLLSAVSKVSMAQEALPDSQFITPTATPGAVFGALNPGLADYPDFTAGQAVTSTLSPLATGLSISENGGPGGLLAPR